MLKKTFCFPLSVLRNCVIGSLIVSNTTQLLGCDSADKVAVPEAAVCETDGPARSPMRRLTPAELDRTLEDLWGAADLPTLTMVPPEQVGGFSNNVDVRSVGSDTVDSYSRLATVVATQMTEDPAQLLTCDELFVDYAAAVEAEQAQTDVGIVVDDHLMLYSAGYVQTSFEVPADGNYVLSIMMQGSMCDEQFPQWTVLSNEQFVAQGFSSAEWAEYIVPVSLSAGVQTIKIVFDNDCYYPETGEDRNLGVDQIALTGESLPVGDLEAFTDCVADWLGDFLPRAWRYSADPSDVERLVGVYQAAGSQWGQSDALRMLIEVILQSPRFLYRVEETALAAEAGQTVPLNGYEMASRLSYFLWGSMPDDELFAAAAAGTLESAEGIEAQVIRMLDDPRSLEVVQLFFEEWMQLDHIDDVEKDLTVYPDWNEDLPASLREETVRFINAVWTEEEASFEELLTADWTVLDSALADFYGLDGPTDGWARVPRDPEYHAGVLTQGSFLASRARAYASSPIHRGMFIRGSMLCHVISAPDASLEIEVPDPDPNATTRELLEQHRADPVCASCHSLIDPPGFAFEHFDGIGQFRTSENGLPIDASAELIATDVDGMVNGAPELAYALAGSAMVHECFTKQWFRFAHGRREVAGDQCDVEATATRFSDQDLDMRALVLATVLSPSFRYAVGSP